MIDNTKARGLQEIYKAHGNGALNALAIECEGIAFVIVKAQCRKYGLRFEREKLEEFSHDAAAQFIAQYLKHADYNVRNFPARIRRDVLNVMFGRARNKQLAFEDGQIQMYARRSGKTLAIREHLETQINAATALDELVADHPQGKKIAADLYRSKTYSMAIRRIAVYVGREWIYEHAEKMHFVFKTFRWRPSENRCVSGNRARPLCGSVLPGKRAKHVEPSK